MLMIVRVIGTLSLLAGALVAAPAPADAATVAQNENGAQHEHGERELRIVRTRVGGSASSGFNKDAASDEQRVILHKIGGDTGRDDAPVRRLQMELKKAYAELKKQAAPKRNERKKK